MYNISDEKESGSYCRSLRWIDSAVSSFLYKEGGKI